MIARRNGVGFYPGELELIGFILVFAQSVVFVAKGFIRRFACRPERNWHKHEGKQDDYKGQRPAICNSQFEIFNLQFSILDLLSSIAHFALSFNKSSCAFSNPGAISSARITSRRASA